MQPLTVIVLVAFVYYAPTIYKKIVSNFKLRSIPTVGASNPLTSYIGAYRFHQYAKELIKEGHRKYRGSVFKIPTITCWMIVVSVPDKVEEIRCAPDDVLSVRGAFEEKFVLDFSRTMLDEVAHVVKTSLTRNVEVRFPDVYDEIIAAFSDHIPARSNEWINIMAYPTIRDIVCRASNRMLVGLPLCRDPDFLELNKQFLVDVSKAFSLVNMVPPILQPLIKPFIMNVTNDFKRGMKHISPLVKERSEREAQYGKHWAEGPNDLLSWLVEISKGKGRSLREITMFILFIDFVAINTTTTTVTQSLYNLAYYPEYVQPLREEIEAVIQEQGWSKASVAMMTKLDSFVKETMRLSPLGAFPITRKTIKDFTFSDGTTIPAGNLISVAVPCIHTDPDNYVDPEIFDGLRFEKMRGEEGELQSKYSLVSLDLSYLLFGHGRHACPGRFFAAGELKTILAYILLNYDVKMADGGGRPENTWFGQTSFPHTKAEVLFRKRV
ncbi:hypothetical protein AX14_003987 [Amanita brunnescens Koide BX004]|nr:hypothetical protein AX14_003987 [Amanita brunnescens Koide BX004]